MFYPGSDCTSADVALFADAVRTESVCRSCRWGGLGLLSSVGLIYRGVHALFSMREDIKALQMATVIAGAGLFMWLILMQIVLIH